MYRISVCVIVMVCTITFVYCHGHGHNHDHHGHDHHHHHDHDHHQHGHGHHHHHHHHDHDDHHHDHQGQDACGGFSKYSAACNQPAHVEIVDDENSVEETLDQVDIKEKKVEPEEKSDDPYELTREEMFARGHMKPFGAHRPPEGMVEEYPYMIAPEDFYQHFVSKHRPVLFRGMAKHWPAYNLWTDEYLREKYGDLEFKMETKDDDKKVFLRGRKLSDFLDEYTTGNLYLVDEVAPEMRPEVTMPLCLRCEEISTKFFVSYVWMSSGGTNSSVHEDTDENLLCVIKGSKKAILISPIYSRDLYADDADTLGVSPVPADKVDLNKYPRVMNVRYVVADMKEGDMLYLPQMWWHQINSGEGRQQAVAMWWKSKPWWKSLDKIQAIPRDPEQAKLDFGSPELKYSFASILSYYERWIQNTSHLIPRPKCLSQFKSMADYHFESDNYETEANVGLADDEEEHIDLHCEFNQDNPDNPCEWCTGDEQEEECVQHMLDYCSKYDDRGCVVILPQVMNRLSQSQYKQIVQRSEP